MKITNTFPFSNKIKVSLKKITIFSFFFKKYKNLTEFNLFGNKMKKKNFIKAWVFFFRFPQIYIIKKKIYGEKENKKEK